MTLEGWTDVVRPLVKYRPMLVVAFIVFIFISAFFLLNLVTAVVVDRTLLSQQEDQLSKHAAEEDGRESQIFDLRSELLKRNHGEDMCTRSNIQTWLQEPGIQAQLHRLDWDPSLAEAALAIIDRGNTGSVSLRSLSQLLGNTARPLDTMALLRMQAYMAQRLEAQEKLLTEMLKVWATK